MLLNTSLTVRHNTVSVRLSVHTREMWTDVRPRSPLTLQAASHSTAGWVPFTQSIISHLANDKTREKGLVFFVWGKHAEKMLGAAKVDTVSPTALFCLLHPQGSY